MLSMDRNELGTDFTEEPNRHCSATERSSRTTTSSDGADSSECPLIDLTSGVADPLGCQPLRVNQDVSGDLCTRPSGPDELGSRPLAKKQLQTRHNHGLAGTCLTGEHGEPRLQLEICRLDHAKTREAQ
jgi:hypothetical protein